MLQLSGFPFLSQYSSSPSHAGILQLWSSPCISLEHLGLVLEALDFQGTWEGGVGMLGESMGWGRGGTAAPTAVAEVFCGGRAWESR